jgi:glutamate--cysteine ligase
LSTREEQLVGQEISSANDLVSWMEAGSKPAPQWRIGVEHEKFLFNLESLSAVQFYGARGVNTILEELIRRDGWMPILEGSNIAALRRPPGEPPAKISLEPGCQFELSGAPLQTLHEVSAEAEAHVSRLGAMGQELGFGLLGIGFAPTWRLEETARAPKERYSIMARYMPSVGKHGLDTMYRACSVQVNMDFADEADMVKKLRISLALQPVVTAIFACSPFSSGRPNGYKSFRSEMWRHTDLDRTGMLPFAFEPGMGFERYVEYAIDVPMYFLVRGSRYIDVAGESFRRFLAGKLDQLPGERPTLQDWSDHVTTLFPEVRLKPFLEMRGTDSGSVANACAVTALWVGLLYDAIAIDGAWQLVKDWSIEELQRLRRDVPKYALNTSVDSRLILDIAKDILAIARGGLRRRSRVNGDREDETLFLSVAEAIVDSRRTPADELLALFDQSWDGNIREVFKACVL